MNLIYICIKLTTYFINLLIAVLGCILLGVGIFALIQAETTFSTLGSSSLIFQPTLMLIIVGGLLAILGSIGAIGAIRSLRPLLIIYCAIIGVMILIEVGIAAYLAYKLTQDRASVEIEISNIFSSLIENYRDDSDLRATIDLLQITFSCCGLMGLNDWNNNVYFSCNASGIEKCGVPNSCCVPRVQLNSQCGFDVRSNTLDSAIRLAANINQEGCTEALIGWVINNVYIIAGVAGGLLLAEILTFVLALLLIFEINAIVKTKKFRGAQYADKTDKRRKSRKTAWVE